MLRKTLTVLAVMAAVGAGTAGVANASTPVVPVPPVGGVDGVVGGVGNSVGGLLGGVNVLGGNIAVGDQFHGSDRLRGIDRFRGGNFGGFYGSDFYGGRYNHYRNTFWNRGGVILPYSQVVSSCGCGDPASLGYQLVENPQTVMVVPVGAVATGDGSCSLSSVNFGLDRYRHGVRFFRR